MKNTQNKKLISPVVCAITCLFIAVQVQAQVLPNGSTGPGAATAVTMPGAYNNGTKVNYVRSREALAPISNTATFASATYAEVKQTTQFIDGLGRPLQSVIKQYSPGLKDMVSPVVYDSFGREQYKYLPYISTENNGGLKLNAFGSMAAFVSAQYPGESVFYNAIQYENSPLNRVSKSMSAGNSWAGSNRGVSTAYLVNTANDSVRIWNITYDTLLYNTSDNTANIPTTNAVYPAGVLNETYTLDENGNGIVEYKDKEGKVILKKVQVATAPSEGHSGWLCTYYVYDDFGLLRFVISPKATEYLAANGWTFSDAVVNELCFRYEYDYRNRMIAKKVPGAGWVYMVYDKRDRLAYTQDANLRNHQQWLASLYDNQNRLATTGIITYAGNRGALQWILNTQFDAAISTTVAVNFTAPDSLYVNVRESGKLTYRAVNSIVFTDGFTTEAGARTETILEAAVTSITNVLLNYDPFPAGANFVALTINYYDDYAFTTKAYSTTNNGNIDDGGNAYPETLPSAASLLTRGLLTGTSTRVIENPSDLSIGSWLETASYYDDKGRVIQTQSDNYKNGTDITTMRYDFSGKVITTYQVHNNPVAAQIMKVKTNLLFDYASRLQSVKKTLNDDVNTTRFVTRNEYNELGQLLNKKIGQRGQGITTEMELQNYEYNIRGWLRGINRGYSGNTGSGAWFGMELNYDFGFTTNQYNGNIAGAQWRSKGDGERRAFGYGYDAANRILLADFNQFTASTWDKTAGLEFTTKMGNGADYTSAYDANGNIKAMQQKGWKVGGSTLIDDLSYTYNTSSNKLLNVIDAQNDVDTKLGDFRSSTAYMGTLGTKANIATDYTYDDNGNLSIDKNKDISGITYNHLNLPYLVSVTGKGTITYIYDAAGNKLEKRTAETSPAKTTKTTYIGGYVYQNDTLQFLAHEEGRIRKNAGNSYVYDYFVKDHLGNTRMVLTDEEQQDAYPVASLESATLNSEKIYYKIPDDGATRVNKNTVAGYPADSYTNPNDYIQRLSGSGTKVGTSITLKVMAGDSYHIRANSWYRLNGETPGTPVSPLTSILASLSGGVAEAGGWKNTGSYLQSSGVLDPAVTGLLNSQTVAAGRPKAYLNWLLLDEQYRYAGGGFEQVGENEAFKTHVKTGLEVTRNGYLYIYVSNETPNVDVFFDNLQVTHVRGPLLEETHYYPFGLTMAGISSKAAGKLENRFKYNGIEFDEDLGLNAYEAFYRTLDPALGRWWQIDPKVDAGYESWSPYVSMYNNPIRFSDPLGDEADDPTVGSVIWNFAKGVGQSVVGTIKGTYNAVTNFPETAKGLYHAATNLPETGKAIVSAVKEGYNEFQNGNADVKANILGKVVGEIAQVAVGAEVVKAGTNLMKGARVAEAVETVTTGTKLSPNVQKALNQINEIKAEGGKVTARPLSAGQELNMSVTKGTERVNIRIETHTVPTKYGGNGVTPQRHLNVDLLPNKKVLPNSGHKILE